MLSYPLASKTTPPRLKFAFNFCLTARGDGLPCLKKEKLA